MIRDRIVRTAVERLTAAIEGLEDFARSDRLSDLTRPAEPTWVGQDGVIMRLRDMPTPYLRHVYALLERRGMDAGPGCGLYKEVDRELRRRSREAVQEALA